MNFNTHEIHSHPHCFIPIPIMSHMAIPIPMGFPWDFPLPRTPLIQMTGREFITHVKQQTLHNIQRQAAREAYAYLLLATYNKIKQGARANSAQKITLL